MDTAGARPHCVDDPCVRIQCPASPLGEVVWPTHYIDIAAALELKTQMLACHASQSSGAGRRPGVFRIIETIEKIRGPRDYFMRSHPAPTGTRKEKDLFEGVE